MNKDISFVFFGTGPLAESVLAALVRNGYTPAIVVTKPDSMQGRHMQLIAPHIKTWCEMKGIPVLQPKVLDKEFSNNLMSNLSRQGGDVYSLFVVASYGKIIPDDILNIPKSGVLNVHPSLLPTYRGPSPIESALLGGVTTTGISIMKLDSGMDHGPILVQNSFTINPSSTAQTLEVECGQLGGELLVQVLPHYLDGTLIPKEQDHDRVTICKKITKDLGEITLTTRADEVQRKFRALTPWPGLYFFITHKEKQIRIKVTAVDLLLEGTETLVASDIILKVIPEGKHEITWSDFVHGYMDSN